VVIEDRGREVQRLHKVLEDAGIKLASFTSSVLTKSGREMIEALIAGQRDPAVMAEMARGRMRAKIPQLTDALAGRFNDHHAMLCTTMLARIDQADDTIAKLSQRIVELQHPHEAAVQLLVGIPGVSNRTAQVILAEIGTDMSRFPTPGHLVSWAKFAPTARQSAGRSKAATAGKGNPWPGGTLGEAAASAARTKTFLASRYKRIARRRGKQRALVAVGNSLLTIIWHLLSDPAARFTDLGPDWHDRLAPLRRKRQLIAELERLSGKKVTLNDAA
jgi:transposase